MNKAELVDNVAKKSGLSNAEAARALNAVLDTITLSLSNNEQIHISGFGAFTVRDRAARNGVNPSTGEAIQIAAHKTAAFKPGTSLKNALS